MGFFKTAPPPPPPSSHVGPKTLLRGDLASSHDVTVEGAAEGSVATTGRFVIASPGRAEGKVRAERLECSGALKGLAVVSRTALFESTASFDGELEATALVVRKGARIVGRLARKPSAP